jgi:hypothetical protein
MGKLYIRSRYREAIQVQGRENPTLGYDWIFDSQHQNWGEEILYLSRSHRYENRQGAFGCGPPICEGERSVIDVKRVFTGVKRPLSGLLIRADGEEGGSDRAAIGSNAIGQVLIGFSQPDFERGMQAASKQFGPNITSEIEGSGAVRKNTSRKRSPIKPEAPR